VPRTCLILAPRTSDRAAAEEDPPGPARITQGRRPFFAISPKYAQMHDIHDPRLLGEMPFPPWFTGLERPRTRCFAVEEFRLTGDQRRFVCYGIRSGGR